MATIQESLMGFNGTLEEFLAAQRSGQQPVRAGTTFPVVDTVAIGKRGITFPLVELVNPVTGVASRYAVSAKSAASLSNGTVTVGESIAYPAVTGQSHGWISA